MFKPLPLDDPRWSLLQHAYGVYELAYALNGNPRGHQQTALIASTIAVAKGRLQFSKCLLELSEVNVPEKFLKWFLEP